MSTPAYALDPFEFTPAQLRIRDDARAAALEIEPFADEIDATAHYPEECRQILFRHGMLAVLIPETYGGRGGDITCLALASEELARVCGASALIVQLSGSGVLMPLLYGTEEQRVRYLCPLADGATPAVLITEPYAGSDPGAMTTEARRTADGYYLAGRKSLIINPKVARWFTVFARTRLDEGVDGISAFLIDAHAPGIRCEPPERTAGLRGIHLQDVVFEDVEVRESDRFGEEGKGFRYAMQLLQRSRVTIGALAVGLAEAALEYARAYARERRQFGRPIATQQGLAFMLADMATEVAAARALVYTSARRIDMGDDLAPSLSGMAKLFASRVAVRVTESAVQVLGGWGYTARHPVERFWRDSKACELMEGTSQIQELVISRELLSNRS